ncbi:MAG: hypothetical protein KF843_14905 [Flavobacteriales bacterium]|nr:hypothetical protein [Flavobacteriales bacterium]
MTIEKISFDKVKKEIEEIFPSATSGKWDLVPEDINKLAQSSGLKLQWNSTDWWTSFERGETEVSDDKFFNVLFKKIEPTDGKVIIVTDECFTDRLAYFIDFKDLKNFSKSIYPNIHKMDFIQPLDYIFVFPSDKLLTIMNHEGYVMQFKNS